LINSLWKLLFRKQELEGEGPGPVGGRVRLLYVVIKFNTVIYGLVANLVDTAGTAAEWDGPLLTG